MLFAGLAAHAFFEVLAAGKNVVSRDPTFAVDWACCRVAVIRHQQTVFQEVSSLVM